MRPAFQSEVPPRIGDVCAATSFRGGSRIIGFGAAAGVLGACLLLYFFNPERVPIYPQCQFRQWTGLDCPGCGGLRAMHHLLHGNVLAALRFNAFAVLLIPVAAGFAVRLAWHWWKGISRPAAYWTWWWVLAASLAVFSVWRNVI